MATGLGRVFELIKVINKSYPSLAYLLDDKEVGPLLLKLADGQFDQSVFQSKLYQTKWWKKTAESTRKWDALWALDPAEARARHKQAKTQVDNVVQSLGVRVGGIRGYKGKARTPTGIIADMSLRYGWNQDQLVDFVLSKATYGQEGKTWKGGIGASMREIRKVSQDYMLPANDRTTFNQAKKILAGEATIDSVAADFADQARTRWGDNETVLGIIDRGGTPMDYFDPIRQEIATELEIAPDAVDLVGDQRFREVVNHADGTTGQIRPMTLTEAVKHTRSLDEWGTTQGAQQQAASMVNGLLQTFGARK